MQKHTSGPHPRDGVREPYGLSNLRHVQPERLPCRGLGHPPPASYLALARVHNAALGQKRNDARGPYLGSLLDHVVHPSTFWYRLIQRYLSVQTIRPHEFLENDSFSPTAQFGGEEPSCAIYDLDLVPTPATQDLENVVGLASRQFEHPAGFRYGVDEDSGYGCARDEAPYLKTPLRRSKNEPPPPL